MIVTSIAYDYYKAFVTAFIEINNEHKTIFGNPPVKKIIKLVNIMALVESCVAFLFTILLIAQLASKVSWWMPFAPLILFFGVYFFFMLGLFIHFMVKMFAHYKNLFWAFCFMLLVPLGLINTLLFFGAMLMVCIMCPVVTTGLYPTGTAYDINLCLFLGMFGALLKSFVRPTQDEANPYSKTLTNKWTTLVYVLTWIGCAIFVVFLTSQIDGKLVLSSKDFDWDWGLVFLPLFLVTGMVVCYGGGVTFFEWRKVKKRKDPNGDALFKSIVYTCITLIFVLLLIAEIIITVYLTKRPLGKQGSAIPLAVPLILAAITLIVTATLPFVMKKKIVGRQDGGGDKKNRRVSVRLDADDLCML